MWYSYKCFERERVNGVVIYLVEDFVYLGS